MKGARDYQKTHLSNGHYNAYNKKSLMVNYNIQVVSSIDIVAQSVSLKAATPFRLNKAFKKDGIVFIEIEIDGVMTEVALKENKNNKIKNRKQLRSFLESFIFKVVAIIEH